MKVLDLFSGIGGFSLGLERAGMETVAFCEIDPFCKKVLKKHWPDVPIYDDVRNLKYEGTVDVICGGYPCQPFSCAGNRKGEDDERHLWPAMFGLIRKHRPDWVIGENVAGHITMGIDDVLFDLECEGYAARSFVIPACAVDARHRRDRVWIVANAKRDANRDEERRGISKKDRGAEEIRLKHGSAGQPSGTSQSRVSNNRHEDVVDRNNVGSEGRTKKQVCWIEDVSRELVGSGSPEFGRWPVEPGVGRVVNGLPRRVDRLRALGNAVVPQVVEQIGRSIMEIEAIDDRIVLEG